MHLHQINGNAWFVSAFIYVEKSSYQALLHNGTVFQPKTHGFQILKNEWLEWLKNMRYRKWLERLEDLNSQDYRHK